MDERVEAAARAMWIQDGGKQWATATSKRDQDFFRAKARTALDAAGLPDLLAENERLRTEGEAAQRGKDACGLECRYVPTVVVEQPDATTVRQCSCGTWVDRYGRDAKHRLMADAVLAALDDHLHCDGDPIECGVQAMEGEFAERSRKLDEAKKLNALLVEALRLRCHCYDPDVTPPTDWHSGARIPHHVDCVLYPIELPDAGLAPSAYADATAHREKLLK
jgi:hypothetical protein